MNETNLHIGKVSGEKSCRPAFVQDRVLPKLVGISDGNMLDVYTVVGTKPQFLFESPFNAEILARKIEEYFNVVVDSIHIKRLNKNGGNGYSINVCIRHNEVM